MSTTPNPLVKQVADAFMRLVQKSLGDAAVAKLQEAAKGTNPSGGKEVSGAVPTSGQLPGGQPEAKPANLPVKESPAVPPEILAAMLQAQLEGHPAAADDLAELGSDPEALAEFLADRDAGTQGMMSSRMFAAMTRTFGAMSGLSRPKVAGVAVRAVDTGRVLMLKRAESDKDEASGKWEFPGGHIRREETPEEGGKREWLEEVGTAFPKGKPVGSWHSKNGVYSGHVWDVPSEDDIDLDGEGDQGEELRWWHPQAIAGNSDMRSELRGDAERVLALCLEGRSFSAFSGMQTFGWASDPTPRSPSRATNSDTGKHLYGEQARRALAWQGREDKGEEHPKTPKQALIEHKQAQEPKREEARAAYQAALKDPGSVRPEQLASLAEHLHTLTRDEVRANLRTLEKSTGGKLKHDLVDALLSHVRESVIAHHEGKLDPMGMGLDQDTALRNIQALEETRPGTKKTPLRQTADEKTTHADRMQQRTDAERAGVKVDKNAIANHPADHVPSTPDKPDANPKSENVLTEHLNRKEGGDGTDHSGSVGGSDSGGGGFHPDARPNPPESDSAARSGDRPATTDASPADRGEPPATERAGPDAVAGGVADAASAHAAADEYAKEAKRIASSPGGNPDAALAHGEAANALRNVAKAHEAIDAENARHAEPAKRVDAANAKVSGLERAAAAAWEREREEAANSKAEGLRSGGDPKDKIAKLKEKLAASKAKSSPQGDTPSASEATASLKNVLHKLRGLDVKPGEVDAELKKLDGMSAPDLLAVAKSLNMDATLSDKTPAAKIRKQIKEQVNAVHKIAVQAPEHIELPTHEERLAQHRKEMGYVPESGNIPAAGDKSSAANQETPMASAGDTHIGGILRDQQERAAVAKKLGVNGKLSPSEANVHFEGANPGPMPAEAVKRRLEKFGIVGAEADQLLAGVKPSGEKRKPGTTKMVPTYRGKDVMAAMGLVEGGNNLAQSGNNSPTSVDTSAAKPDTTHVEPQPAAPKQENKMEATKKTRKPKADPVPKPNTEASKKVWAAFQVAEGPAKRALDAVLHNAGIHDAAELKDEPEINQAELAVELHRALNAPLHKDRLAPAHNALVSALAQIDPEEAAKYPIRPDDYKAPERGYQDHEFDPEAFRRYRQRSERAAAAGRAFDRSGWDN